MNKKTRKACEHERYHLFIIYKNKQVNLHRKGTLSKTHLLSRYKVRMKKKTIKKNIYPVLPILDFLFKQYHIHNASKSIRVIKAKAYGYAFLAIDICTRVHEHMCMTE